MIVKEYFFSPLANKNLIKIYSDNNFFIESEGLIYRETIVDNKEMANKFTETNIAIPDTVATQEFVYSILIGEYKNISEEQIRIAKPILLKALRNLNDEEAYKIKFFFNQWNENEIYVVGDRVIYNNELYNVVKIPNNILPPDENKECFKKTIRPLEYVDEWLNGKIYNIGDQIKIGKHFYKSVIENNAWSPMEFPAGWLLIE